MTSDLTPEQLQAAQEQADMDAAYRVLMTAMMNACSGKPVNVGIAAGMSIAFSLAVDSFDDEAEARKYLEHFFASAMSKVSDAFKHKEEARGSIDAGECREEEDQEVA